MAGFGCTTCIGNSGPLPPEIDDAVTHNDLTVAAVLSGNRNFEARIHQRVKANFLASPMLVVIFALADVAYAFVPGHVDEIDGCIHLGTRELLLECLETLECE